MSRSLILVVGMISVGSGQWDYLDLDLSMPRVVVKAVGDTVWLGPTNPTDVPIYAFRWDFQGMFLAGYDVDKDNNASNVDRVRLHHHNFTLEIRDLVVNDTGTYTLTVQYPDWFAEQTYLHVLEGGHGGEPEEGHGGGLTSGAIAGIVCGLLFAVAVAVGLVLLAMFKLRRVWELPRLEDGMRLSELTPKAAL